MLWKIFYYPSCDSVSEREKIVEADTVEEAIEILAKNEKPYFYCWTNYEPLKPNF